MRPSRLLASLGMISRDPTRFGRQLTAAWDVLKRYLATPVAHPNEAAIFVLGVPKSGTTAIGALLAAYGGLSATLDLWPRLHRPETLAAAHSGPEGFQRFLHRFRADFARDLVKDPHLTFLYPRLAQRFPRARFVMVVRDPRDTIRSTLNRLGLPGDLEALGPEHYRRMRPLWEAVLKSPWLDLEGDDYVERLASRWALAAGLYREHRDAMELVRFEDFLADKEAAIAELAARLGVPRASAIADRVDTRYQPPGDRGVSWRRFFGPDRLARIEEICHNEAQALGYFDES